jgi:hypothetical protein
VATKPIIKKALLECVCSNGEQQSATEAFREFNNVVGLTGRYQVSHVKMCEVIERKVYYSAARLGHDALRCHRPPFSF